MSFANYRRDTLRKIAALTDDTAAPDFQVLLQDVLDVYEPDLTVQEKQIGLNAICVMGAKAMRYDPVALATCAILFKQKVDEFENTHPEMTLPLENWQCVLGEWALLKLAP